MKKLYVLLLFACLFAVYSTSIASSQTAAAEVTKPLPTSAVDVAAISKGLADPALWRTILFALIAGALGGVVYELILLQGRLELPHKVTPEEMEGLPPKSVATFLYDIGVFARIIIGALAAIAAVMVMAPATTFSMIAISVVAGSAGTSIFRSVQDRILAGIAQQQADKMKSKAKLATEVVAATKDTNERLRQKTEAAPVPDVQGQRKLIDDMNSQLNEALGMLKGI